MLNLKNLGKKIFGPTEGLDTEFIYIDKIKKGKIIEDLKETEFYGKLIQIWQMAEVEIHPFQKGDTYQSSQHCFNVLQNLNNLIRLDNVKMHLTKLDKYLLCCSATLHDIDKAVIDYEDKIKTPKIHGEGSAAFIKDFYFLFKFTIQEAEAVSNIVCYHGDRNLFNINEECPSDIIEDPPFL